jgi:hypothetical protein
MVYVFPNTLQISPPDPLNTERVVASAYIGIGWDLNFPCGAALGYTKTYIHLLRRHADSAETWAKAVKVATYDCSTQCCLNLTKAQFIPNNPGNNFTGWRIEFPPLHTMPVGVYEFMAIDDGDFKNIAAVDTNRVAILRVEVIQDPDQIIVIPPPSGGTTTTECEAGDYLCLYKDYLPYAAVGVVLIILLMSGGRKHR